MENYQKVPEFVARTPEVEELKENKTVAITPKIKDLDNVEKYSFRESLTRPSKLKIDQSHNIIDFDSYKGDLSILYKDLSELYQNINNWNDESVINIAGYVLDTDLNEFIHRIAYLPNHLYLGNLIEIAASLIINGGIDVGSIIDNENVFQNFKRIYTHRVQIVLLPFLFCVYNLDRKLLPIKKTAWNILNKNGRFFEASNIMSDIQKSMIRIKKCQELLTQEKFNIDDKFQENIDLLLILSGKENLLFPVFQAYKRSNDDGFNLEKYLTENYKATMLKPFTQQLLIYKPGTYANQIQAIVSRWTGKSNEPQFRNYLSDAISQSVEDMEFKAEDFYNISRDIIFSVMDVSKKRNWDSITTIKELVFAVFDGIIISDTNRLRLISYCIGSHIVGGVLKIKYKIEEGVQGLAKGLVHLADNFDDDEKRAFFSNPVNHKIISEALYNGFWDTSFEVFPNMLTIEKNADLLISNIKSELTLK